MLEVGVKTGGRKRSRNLKKKKLSSFITKRLKKVTISLFNLYPLMEKLKEAIETTNGTSTIGKVFAAWRI